MLKVLKVIGLQYRYNISKKEVRKGVHFLHADEHQCFYRLGYIFQRVLQLLLFFIVIQIFYGGPAMFIVTFFLAQPD